MINGKVFSTSQHILKKISIKNITRGTIGATAENFLFF